MGMLYNSRAISRREVEEKLKNAGDYVKMDFLSSCLKKEMDFDTKKFVLMKLAEVYELRRMYYEAAKTIRNAAEINVTFEGKLKDFMKSAELFVKSGNFDESDISFNKALGSAKEIEKVQLKQKRKEWYRAQANDYVLKDKRSHAMSAYEKLLGLELNPAEKKEVQTALLGLYEKLGKVKEFYALRANMN